MSRVRRGWQEVAIQDLCSLENGRAFKPTDWSEEGLPIVRIQNLNRVDAPFNRFSGEVAGRYYLRGGELLFAWSGTPGTSFGAHVWRGGDAVLNQHIFRVDFDSSIIEKRFFRHAINQKLDELIDVAHGGVGLRHVTKGVFERTRVLVPPLPEQKRIADKLDTLLTNVDACRNRLDRVPAILKRFRQSVLAAATSGELTRDWREERDRAMDEWETTTVETLVQSKPRNGYSPRAVEYPTPVKSLTLTATTSGQFRGEHFKYIDAEIPPDSHLWLFPGDILIQRANTIDYVGVSAMFDGPPSTFIHPDLMMKCRPNDRVLAKFLHYVLSSQPVRTFFRENATGTAGNMPKINQQTVLAAPASLPPLEEQREIIQRVETLYAFADQLELRYQASLQAVKKLAPSLLAKAFSGELVPQDPNDEPASVLLERIQAERAAGGQSPPRRGQRTAPQEQAESSKSPSTPTSKRLSSTQTAPTRPPRLPSPEPEPEDTAAAPDRRPLDEYTTDEMMSHFRAASRGSGEMTEEGLFHLVLARLGFERLGTKVTPILKGHMKAAVGRGIIERDGFFVRCKTPTILRYERPVLVDALTSVMRKNYPYEREEVIQALAVHLGYSSVSDAMRETMKSVFNAAIRQGVLIREGNTITRGD